jgi:hypothetical protein
MDAQSVKWEYCRLTGCKDLGYDSPHLIFYTQQGQRSETLSSPSSFSGVEDIDKIAMRIAELGLDGWEMVGAVNTSASEHCVYFKRSRV